MLSASFFSPAAWADDFAALCADRTALERVYHSHRLAAAKSFEETMPPRVIAQLTHADLHKEAVLRQVYGVEITPTMIDAEVQRIDTTTRAPEVLAEIKEALGHDPARFARVIARPIVVERTLRARFERDDALHAARRHVAEEVRDDLLAGKPVSDLQEVTWQLTCRRADSQKVVTTPATPTKIVAQAGVYSVEATAQVAQVMGAAAVEKDRDYYFEDVDPVLQGILRVQLQKAGDVSTVIETPSGFLVFVARKKTEGTLSAASRLILKRGYEEWLAQQLPEVAR